MTRSGLLMFVAGGLLISANAVVRSDEVSDRFSDGRFQRYEQMLNQCEREVGMGDDRWVHQAGSADISLYRDKMNKSKEGILNGSWKAYEQSVNARKQHRAQDERSAYKPSSKVYGHKGIFNGWFNPLQSQEDTLQTMLGKAWSEQLIPDLPKLEGNHVCITFDSDLAGSMSNSFVRTSSGNSVLDDAAMKVLKDSVETYGDRGPVQNYRSQYRFSASFYRDHVRLNFVGNLPGYPDALGEGF